MPNCLAGAKCPHSGAACCGCLSAGSLCCFSSWQCACVLPFKLWHCSWPAMQAHVVAVGPLLVTVSSKGAQTCITKTQQTWAVNLKQRREKWVQPKGCKGAQHNTRHLLLLAAETAAELQHRCKQQHFCVGFTCMCLTSGLSYVVRLEHDHSAAGGLQGVCCLTLLQLLQRRSGA